MYHNYTKIKCFIVLVGLQPEYDMRATTLARQAGVNILSLYVLLARWERWGYVKRWWSRSNGRRVFYYSLTKNGRSWLKAASGWHPQYTLAVEEVEALRAKASVK